MKLFAKSPRQMRREAERGNCPAKPEKLDPIDPVTLPRLAADTGRELDATIEWLAHVQAGRIAVK
jgi:hypothetical protein